jgi:hypothetical protein
MTIEVEARAIIALRPVMIQATTAIAGMMIGHIAPTTLNAVRTIRMIT